MRIAQGFREVTEHYKKKNYLGEGSFGKVYKAHKIEDESKLVAIKQIDKNEMEASEFEMQYNEIEILKVVRGV